MKVNYSRLRCPYCGADDFSLSGADVFLCHYCNEKFNFNLDEIEFTPKNKVFVEDLKAQFYDKIKSLYKEMSLYREKLNYYNKLAYPKKLKIFSYVGLLISVICIGAVPLLFAPLSILFLGLTFFSYNRAKNKYNKHHPAALHYASKIVDLENEVNFYTKLISKLTI